MGIWNLGSVATEVNSLIEGLPSNLSGSNLNRLMGIADRQREYVQNYTGQIIGSNSIETKYQEAILQLTIAKVVKDMQSYGADGANIRLGDFSISNGKTSNLDTIYENSIKNAQEELRVLGKTYSYYKAFG
jgi:hypothetical protein